MSNSTPPVGVDLVALGAADFLQALQEANQRMIQSQNAAKNLIAQLAQLPSTNQKAQQTIAILVNQIHELSVALGAMRVAQGLGTAEAEKATKAYLEANDALRQTVATSKEVTGVGPKAATGVGNVTREARGLRDALFGAGLGLSLLDSALGNQLPASAKQATNSLRLTADTMLAFAFLAPESGVVGLAIGAAIGLITSLGISALTVDPQIKALTDSLDKLGKKDDAAQGLAKLAGISDKNAAAALEYLKANDQFADSFQKLVQNAQPAIPVLQGIGDALRAAGDARRDFADSLAATIPGYKAWIDFLSSEPALLAQVTTYNAVYAKTLRETGSVVLAATAASKAQQEAVVTSANAQAKATNDLTKAAQAYADIQNEINSVTNRVAAQSAQETIDKLRLEGAGVDELDLQYLKLLQDKEKANGIQPSFNGARAYAASPIGIPQADEARKAAESDYSFLTGTANKLARELLSVQQKYNDDSAALEDEHGQRIVDIESAAYTQQLRIEREFGQRRAEIQAQYDQDVADAGADYTTRLQDILDNANETRTKNDSDYADKRAKIEQDYQDKIAQIQADYALSLIDIDARRDGLALLRARAARDKALKDAQKTKDRENADAQKQHDKAQKELDDALAKQKKKLDEENERRLRDLKQRYDKENAANGQNYADQIADLIANTTAQQTAEANQYKKRKKQLDDQLKERKQSIIDNLDETLQKTKDKEEEYARAIIESLRNILDPTTIAELLNDLQKALDAKIEIKVTPFNANLDLPTQPPGPPKPHALGGYIALNEYAYLHAGETVLPTSENAYALAMQHFARWSIPMGGRGAGGAEGGKVYVYIDNALNHSMLMSEVRVEAIGVTAEIIKRGRT